MKTGPKAKYVLEARDKQDAGFNITGKLSEKIRGKPGQKGHNGLQYSFSKF